MSSLTSKEVQELQFKLLSHLRLFTAEQNIKLDNPTSLVATASKYGLIFVGTPTGVTCIQTNTIISIQSQRTNNRGYITSFPRRELKLGVLPTHVAVSCDHELLALTLIADGCPLLLIYSVTAFGTPTIKTKCEVRMSSTPGVVVTDLQWNPGVSNIIGAVLSDGSAYVYEFKDSSPTISSIPPNAQASCLCWSPKGKQIVIGGKDGTLTQYKPDLKVVKMFHPPQIFNQPMVISVHWLSNYQFITAYKDRMDVSSKPAVVLINVPKGGQQSFVNCENICFGFGTNRPEHYFIHQQPWNIIIIGTSNGTDVAVLGLNNDTWEQWLQDESNRALLPVSLDYQDVYLTGMAVDYSPQNPVLIGENSYTNPMPFLLMYSQEGVLSIYHIINLAPNIPPLCHAPQPLPDQSGIHLFVDVQNVQSGNIKGAEEVQTVDNSESNKSINATQSIQGTQFQLPSSIGTGTGISLQPPKESQMSSNLPTQSPFASLNLQKQIPSQISNANQGISTLGSGFGMMIENSSASTALTTPKFSTSSPLISQQPPNSSPLAFNIAATPQKISTQPNTTLNTLNAQQQLPNNKGLNTFQFPIISMDSPFPTTATSETSVITQNVSKPALLMTPLQTNNSISVTSHGITVPSIAEKFVSNKELTTKDELTKQTERVIPQSKETDLNKLSKIEEEKEQPVIEVDFIGATKEEVSNFKREVASLQQLKKSLNFNVEHEEINELVAKINDLKVFEKDVKETTTAQEAEVNALVNSVVEMFSWLESVKAKQKQLNNPRLMDLMETQDLDPVTKKHINNIEQYIYYLDTQIKQANIQLDTLWAQYKGKPFKSLELPNMETIYQTIVAENYILAAQKLRVTELEVRLKDKLKSFSRKIPELADFSSTSLKSNSDTELDELADKLLMSKLGHNEVTESNSLKSIAEKYMIMGNRQKYLSSKKEILLHKWHKNHVVINAKSPKRPTGQIDLTKFSKQIKTVSLKENVPESVKISTSTTTVPSKSIFATPFLTQKTVTPIQMPNAKETKPAGSVGTPLFAVKTDGRSSQEKQLPFGLQKVDILNKNKADTLVKETISNQVPFVVQANQGQSALVSNDSATKQSFSSIIDSGMINNSSDKNLKNTVSFAHTPNANREVVTTVPLQTAFTVDPNFSFKIPPSATSVSSTVETSSSNANLTSKFIATVPTTTTTEVPKSSTSPININKENYNQSKDIIKKETQTISDSQKDLAAEMNKTTFTLTSSPFSATSTAGTNLLEKPVSSAANIFGTNTVISSVGNIFGGANTIVSSAANMFGTTNVASSTANSFKTTTDSGQNALSTFSFNKSSVFSTAVTTGTKAQLMFGFPAITGNTTTTSTSIFGGKSLNSSQFVSSNTTVPSASTTSSPPPTSTITSKVTTPASSTTIAAPATTSFFTKPSAMKSLFSDVQLSSQNNSSAAFKSPSALGTTVFSSSPSQQVQTIPASSTAVTTATKVESVPSSGSIPAAAIAVTTTTSPAIVPCTTVSNVISSSPESFSFNNTLVLNSTEPTSGNNLIPSSTSVVSAVAAPSVVASIGTTSASTPTASTPISEKEITTTSAITATATTSFGMTSGSSTGFGAKTTAQNVSVFQTPVSTSAATTKAFGDTGGTTAAFSPTPTETGSMFGGNNVLISVFGNQVTVPSFSFNTTATKTTTAPMFGTASTFGTPTTNAFGAATALSSTSFFGSPTTTSAFGTPPAQSPFSPTSSTNTTSFFGQPVCSSASNVTNAFSNISFGQKPATVTTAAGSIFGNRAFESKPLFGQSESGLFCQTTSSPGTFGSSGGSLFGNASSFGSPRQTNLFQLQTGPSGGNLLQGSPGGSFSAGNQSVAQSGFGTSPNFQNAAKPFGASGPSMFGGQSTFGSSPTFGGSATFGSPNKVFGTPSPGATTFGSPSQSSTFENLAGQNTLTFGNLAQGQPTFNSNQPFGMASPPQQNTFQQNSSFGGSSFSTWR